MTEPTNRPDPRSPRRGRRKLLAATLGLAAVSMIGAGCSSGNLVSPDAGGALRDAPADSGQNDDGGTSR
jgi:hypothetical protein